MITLSMLFAIIGLASTLSIWLHLRILPERKDGFMIGFTALTTVLIVVNYYALIAGRKWSRFEQEFRRGSSAVRLFGSMAVWACVVLLLVVGAWTASIAVRIPA